MVGSSILPSRTDENLKMQSIKTKVEIPEEVKGVSSALAKAGFENCLVGGCVRDLIMGREPKDWDIATKASPEQIQDTLPDSFYENNFGTVGVKTESAGIVEVTPYRREARYTDFRHPDKVEWAETIEADLARRDFTINAIALNLQPTTDDQQLVDPFGGQGDIEKKVIRTVGKPEERFGEDALRMLRALRLAAELGFALEHETQEAIGRNAELLSHISKERVRDEFTKIVMSDSPALALELVQRLGLLKFIAPELEKGIGVEQNKAHIYTVWEHLLRSLDHAAKKGQPLHVRLAALLHDVAKPHTRKMISGQWTFYGHEVVGAKLARQTLSELKYPKDIVEKVGKLVRWHMFFSETETITLSAVRRIVRNVGPDLIWDLMNVRAADRTGMGRPKETTYRLRKYYSMIEEVLRDPISVKQLKVNGADIMKLTSTRPGPHIGFMLEILLSEVLENPKLNTKEYLEKRASELHELDASELRKLGEAARERNLGEEEREKEQIREKYKVE